MSRFRSKGLVAAMEADEEILEAPEVDETEVALDVSETSAEVADEVEEVESAETSIDDASDDVETLGSIQAVMADSVESGEGMSEQAAEIAEIAVEAICARLGIKTAGRIMPATESFGSASTRVAATKIALETTEEKSKTVMESIKAAWARVWQKIKEFIGKFTGNIEALEKQAGVLKTKLAAAKDYSPKDANAELTDSAILNALAINGKLAPSEILQGHVKLANSVPDLLDAVEKLNEGITPTFQAASKDATKIQGMYSFLDKGYESIQVSFGGLVGIGPLINGGRVKIGLSKKSDGNAYIFNITTVSVSVNTVKSAKFLTVSEAESLLGEVETLLKSIRDYKAIQDRVKKLETSLFKASVVAGANAGKEGADKNYAETMINAAQLATVNNKIVTKASLSFPGMNLQAARYALSYIAKSLASLETPKAAK